MKVNYYLTSMLAVTAMFVASCGTQQLATNTVADDVYNSNAQARIYKPAPAVQTARIDTSSSRINDAGYIASNPNYDMDYYSRIDRFYYGNNYRCYYDDYYNYYGYNSWYNPYYGPSLSLGFNMGWGYNNYWSNPYYNSWAYYGSPYRYGMWGPYSYGMWGNYNSWYGGGWNTGYYGGGYWANNVSVRNNNPRPTRGVDRDNVGRNGNSGYMPSRNNVGTMGSANRPSRAEGYNPVTTGRTTGNNTATSDASRPARGQATPSATRTENYTPSRPVRDNSSSRPSYTPPATSSSSGSSSGSSSSGSSGGGGGSRPTRSGGRG